MYVHVKDEKWSKAIETCLGRFGYGFGVCNFDDFNVLTAIIKQTCTNFFPAVVMCPFEVVNTIFYFSL